jgi:hypothetical protein
MIVVLRWAGIVGIVGCILAALLPAGSLSEQAATGVYLLLVASTCVSLAYVAGHHKT